MQSQTNNKRNQNGVKNSCDQYRTINGERWIQWTSNFNQQTVKLYRAAGVKVRVVGGDELFIRQVDADNALKVKEN